MSTITLPGTIGADPRIGKTDTGIDVASFRMAVTERRFDAARGEWTDGQTSWVTVVAFRKLALHIAASLKKGSRVMVMGQLRVSTWERDGKSGTNVEIVANEVGTSLLFGTTIFNQTVGGRAEGEDLVQASLTLAGATTE